MNRQDLAESMFGGHTGLGTDRDDEDQITVWPPQPDGTVHVWFENADGECSFELDEAERRWLIEKLQAGLT